MADQPVVTTAEALRANLATVRDRIAGAARRVGRQPDEIRLLPVSKTVHDERIAWLAEAGVALVGENKVQEAVAKGEEFARLGLRWAMIGHLQTNKVRPVIEGAAELHSLDRRKLAEALDRRLQAEGRGLDVFIQVNSSGEESKYGLDPADVPAFATGLADLSALRVRGLMTLAVFSPDPDRVRPCFEVMVRLRNQLRQDIDADSFAELSMGMSGDYELAIEHGATTVRVGEAIFGPRHTGPADYWPGDASATRAATAQPDPDR